MRRTLMTLVALLGLSMPAMAEENKPNLMTVQGTGKVSIEPDVGYITLGVVSRDAESTKALEVNAKSMEAVYASLAKLGVKKKDVQTVDFSVQEERKQVVDGKVVREEFVGYVVVNLVRVTVCDLKSFGKVLDVVVKDGGNKVQDVSFGSTTAKDQLDKARVLACKDAKRKAKQMADALEVTLGEVNDVREDAAGYRPRAGNYARSMTAESARADTQVSGGSLEFTVNVTVAWKLAPGKTKIDNRLFIPLDEHGNELKKRDRKYEHPPALPLDKHKRKCEKE